jgi:nickel transport protein
MRSTYPRLAIPLLTIFAVMASAGMSSAHDLWLTFTGNASARQVVLNYGHPGDRPPALADKVLDLTVIAGKDRTSLTKGLSFAIVRGAPVAVSQPFNDNGRQLIAAAYDNGLWFKAPDGEYRNGLPTAAQGANSSIWSRKFAKAITGSGAPFNTVVGHDIEIVPLTDPAAAARDSTLQVRVLFEGKPLPNVKVETSQGRHHAEAQTNSEGIAATVIRGGGDYTLSVSHRKAPSSMPALAESDLLGATYSFALPRASFRDWFDLLGF